MPVVMSEHSMRLRVNPTGQDCDTAQTKEQWQAMTAPHIFCDPGWVSAEPMIDSPAANTRRGAYPLPSANEQQIMERICQLSFEIFGRQRHFNLLTITLYRNSWQI